MIYKIDIPVIYSRVITKLSLYFYNKYRDIPNLIETANEDDEGMKTTERFHLLRHQHDTEYAEYFSPTSKQDMYLAFSATQVTNKQSDRSYREG